MRLGIVGQPCIDEIIAADGTLRERSLGGIFYSYAAMDHFMRSSSDDTYIGLSWRSIPDENILAPFINSLRRIESAPKFPTTDLTNRVRLVYSSDGSRKEECAVILPPLTIKELSQIDIAMPDGIFVNMISGFDLTLETLEWIHANTKAHVHLDVHALILGDVSPAAGSARLPHGVANWQRWLRCADSLQMNELEARWFGDPEIRNEEELIGFVRKDGLGSLIITRAERGATCYQHDREFHVDSVPVNVLDPTGSGDVFGSAFLYEFIRTRDHEAAITFAVQAATKNCEMRGLDGWNKHHPTIAMIERSNHT